MLYRFYEPDNIAQKLRNPVMSVLRFDCQKQTALLDTEVIRGGEGYIQQYRGGVVANSVGATLVGRDLSHALPR